MSLKVGKIANIDIKLHFSWFIIFFLVTWSLAAGYLPSQYTGQSQFFYWGVGIMASTSLFLSVLVHEVFHSLVALRNKINVGSITLYFFGGVSEISEEAQTPSSELKMAAAGPLTSLALGFIFLAAWVIIPSDSLIWLSATLEYVAYINLILAAFNLLPAFPMDGGRVLRAFIWMRRGNIVSSTRTATQISRFFSYLIMALGLFSFIFLSSFSGLWLLIIGLFIRNSAEASLNETIIVEALGKINVEEIMAREVHTVEPGLSIQNVVDNYFTKYKHHGFPVVKGDDVIGLLCEHDIRRVPQENWDEVRIESVMTPKDRLITAKPKDKASEALILMSKHQIGRLPVMEQGRLVGIVTRSDINKTIKDRIQFRA